MNFRWALTYRCSWKCNHCYILGRSVDPEMPLREQRSVIRSIREYCNSNDVRGSVILTGGDPLLSSNILEIIQMCNKEGINVSLECNPDMLSLNIIDILQRIGLYRITFGFETIDRKFAESLGRGNTELIFKWVRCLSASEILVRLHVTIWGKNVKHLAGLYRVASQLGASEFSFSRWFPTKGTASYDIPQSNMYRRSLLELLEEKSKINHKKIKSPKIFTTEPLFAVLMNEIGILDLTTLAALKSAGYRFGQSEIFIEPDGTVHPGAFSSNPLGNLTEQSLINILKNNEFLKNLRSVNSFKQCAKCDSFKFCCGEPEMSFLKSGNFFGNDPLCWKLV